jgi:hypothetical protein
MITTRMSVKEIFKEFEKDKDLVYSRFDGFVHTNKESLLRIQKQHGKNYWVPCKGVRHPIINYNKYRGCIKVNFITSEKFSISSVTYLILNDSITGGKIVYLMPAEESDTWLITMTPKFFEEFNQKMGYTPESFTESVDNFMKQSGSYEAYENQELGDPRYNCQVDLGNGWTGFGRMNREKSTIKLRHFYTFPELSDNGYQETDPLKIFLKLREGNKEDDEKEPSKTELSQKQKEIEAAWAELENREYDLDIK